MPAEGREGMGAALAAPLVFPAEPGLAGLTNDLDCKVDLVLPNGVLHCDNVDALIFLLCPLDSEDAAVLGGLHSDPALSLTQQLVGDGGRKSHSQTPEASAASVMLNSPKTGTELAEGLLGRHSPSRHCTRVGTWSKDFYLAPAMGKTVRQWFQHPPLPWSLDNRLSSLCCIFLILWEQHDLTEWL